MFRIASKNQKPVLDHDRLIKYHQVTRSTGHWVTLGTWLLSTQVLGTRLQGTHSTHHLSLSKIQDLIQLIFVEPWSLHTKGGGGLP